MEKSWQAVEIIDPKYGDDLACGYCYSVLYGYDEVICPCCGQHNDFNNMVKMTYKEHLEKFAMMNS